jgi:AAA15 family ATPase/GTPase
VEEEGMQQIQLSQEELSDMESLEDYGLRQCRELAIEITDMITHWLKKTDDNQEQVVKDFERRMNFSPQILRREYKTLMASSTSNEDEKTVSMKGESVLPLKINSDGTLQIKMIDTDEERTLIADYLW